MRIFHHTVNTHIVFMLLHEFYEKHILSSILRACFIENVFTEFFDIHISLELNCIVIASWYVDVHCKGG